MNIRFKMTEEEYEKVVALEKQTKDKNISRRLKVLKMRYEGFTCQEIAEHLDLHKTNVSAMCMRYMQQGLEEYARNKYTSHNRLLSEEKETEILEEFSKEAEAGHMVTVKEIKAAFDEVCGKDTGNVYIYNVLKRNQWRKVMPRPKHPKSADEEACNASKKLIKKSQNPLHH